VAALERALQVSLIASVAGPDPYVLGPPGSGSISMMYGSVSRATIVRKTTVLWLLYDFLSLKNDVNVVAKECRE
jgi:hypothetical protein